MSDSPEVSEAAPAPAEPPPSKPELPHVAVVIDRLWKLWWIVAGTIGICAPLFWFLAAQNLEPGTVGAMVLLMMSPFLLVFAALTAPQNVDPPHGVIAMGGVLLEAWKAICLTAYHYCAPSSPWAARIALVAIVIDVALLVIVIWFVRRVIVKSTTQAALRNGLFAVLCGVLALFMHVTYSCTFALALHDRSVRDALHPSRKQWVKEVALGFREGTTTIDEALEISDQLPTWPDDDTARRRSLEPHIAKMMKKERVARGYAAVRKEEIYQELAANISSWRDVTETLTSDVNAIWRVAVVGHSSDHVKVLEKTTEWNNYEFSENRANYVYHKLRDAMRKAHVRSDWSLAAVANVDPDMGNIPFIKGRDKKLSARVFVEKQAGSLSLLDYLYFMTYTITTTGYGDLIPTTPFAKFITCVANLFEILFIVVVINLVFAYAKAGT